MIFFGLNRYTEGTANFPRLKVAMVTTVYLEV